MATVHSGSPVACPRCGYDLSGTPASWTSHCPPRGQCTECGLELEWSRVFALSEHDWLFDYHWRRGPLRRLIMTVLHALRPRRFWTQVRMTDPIHPGPLVTLAALCALLALLLAWTVPWWCIACRHYLRLCHPRAVALLLGTVALFLGLLIETTLYAHRWF